MNGADFRIFYEKYGLFKLAQYLKISSHLIIHLSNLNATAPYDLEYNNIRYDVKISSPTLTSKDKKTLTWDFSLRKRNKGKRKGHNGIYCDYFLLIGMLNSIPKRVFLVPIKETPTNHLRVSIKGTSKYHKYEI